MSFLRNKRESIPKCFNWSHRQLTICNEDIDILKDFDIDEDINISFLHSMILNGKQSMLKEF
jgi:hypothetical protein